MPFTADDVDTARGGNHTATLGGTWFDLDGDGVQDFDTDLDGTIDTGNEVGQPVSGRPGRSADIPYSSPSDGHQGNFKTIFSTSYPQFGQFVVGDQGFHTHHIFHGNTFAGAPPLDGSQDDIDNWFADDANRNREFHYSSRNHKTHQDGGNAPTPYAYNNDRANQWPWVEGSKYFYAHKNNLMFRQNFPKTVGNWAFNEDIQRWVFADPDDVDYGTLQHPGGFARSYDLDNDETGGQGLFSCQNDFARPVRAEVRGLLIPVDDIAGLADGSLTDPFGWAGEGFDMAAYVRDVLGPRLQDAALATRAGSSNCGNTGSNDLAGGPPTHILIEQYEVNVPVFEVWATNGFWYGGIDGQLSPSRAPVPGDEGFTIGLTAPFSPCGTLQGAIGAGFQINKLEPTGATVTIADPLLPAPKEGFVASTSATGGGAAYEECVRRGGDCATTSYMRYSHILLVYNDVGIAPTVDIGSQTTFETVPADGTPRNLWALDTFFRRGPAAQRNIHDLGYWLGRYIRHPLEGDRTGDGLIDDYTREGTPYNCKNDTDCNVPENLVPPRSWGVTDAPSRQTEGCNDTNHRVIFNCRRGSLELPFSGGVELDPYNRTVKRYRDARTIGGIAVSSVSFAYTGATALVPEHVVMDTLYVAEELAIESNPQPDLQVAVETGLGDLRTAWAPITRGEGLQHIIPPCGETGDPTPFEDPQPLEGQGTPTQQIILKHVPPRDSIGAGGGSIPAFPATGDGSAIDSPPGADETAIVWANINEDGSSIHWAGTVSDRGLAVNPAASEDGGVPTIGDAGGELYTRYVLLFDGFRAQLYEAQDGIPEGDYQKNNFDFLGDPNNGYSLLAESTNPYRPFRRGDCNSDGGTDLSDGVFILNFAFQGADAPGCLAACDYNNDGALDVTNAIFLFNALFQGGIPIVEPRECAIAAGPLTCESFTPCE